MRFISLTYKILFNCFSALDTERSIDHNNFLEEYFELPYFFNRDVGWSPDLIFCDSREKYSDICFLRARRRAIKFHENNLSTFVKKDIVNVDLSVCIELEEKFHEWLINKHCWSSDPSLQLKNMKMWLNHGWSWENWKNAQSQYINANCKYFTHFELIVLRNFEVELISVHTNLKLSEEEENDWIVYPSFDDDYI